MNTMIHIFLRLGLLACLIMPSLVQGQEESGRFILDKLNKAVMKYTSDDQPLSLMRVEVGSLMPDSSAYIMTELASGRRYEFRTFTDPDQVQNVRLRIYRVPDEGDRVLEIQDLSLGPESFLIFEPPYFSDYRIDIIGSAYEDPEKGGYYGFIITSEQL